MNRESVNLESDQRPVVWIVTDGKIGDRVQCLGVAAGLAGRVCEITIHAGSVWSAVAPWGPAAPGDLAKANPPFPDIVIVSGRRAIPFARAVKRRSKGASFVVILKDPRAARRFADLIWAPKHDQLVGRNVFSTLTSPHGLGVEKASHPEIDTISKPLLGLVLGGPSGGAQYGVRDAETLAAKVMIAAKSYASLAVTPSRRTPETFMRRLKERLKGPGVFVWGGEGENPYASILANADTLIVAADSHNMMSEACASKAGVYAWRPRGMAKKLSAFVDELQAFGRVRPLNAEAAAFNVHPVNATAEIVEEITRRINESA